MLILTLCTPSPFQGQYQFVASHRSNILLHHPPSILSSRSSVLNIYLFDIKSLPTQALLMQLYQPLAIFIIFPICQDTCIPRLFSLWAAAADLFATLDSYFLRGRWSSGC
mmetsp:Transcript_4868/g.7120  ORF Transcript_4868/g.7120 Transcript_4868/m.7120 type:complete len:110 (-) Transcript_4868:174-503(-)